MPPTEGRRVFVDSRDYTRPSSRRRRDERSTSDLSIDGAITLTRPNIRRKNIDVVLINIQTRPAARTIEIWVTTFNSRLDLRAHTFEARFVQKVNLNEYARDLNVLHAAVVSQKRRITLLYARINLLAPAYRDVTSYFPRLLVCHCLSRKGDIGELMECTLLAGLRARFKIYIVGGKLRYFKMIGRMMYFYAYIERGESVTQECAKS